MTPDDNDPRGPDPDPGEPTRSPAAAEATPEATPAAAEASRAAAEGPQEEAAAGEAGDAADESRDERDRGQPVGAETASERRARRGGGKRARKATVLSPEARRRRRQRLLFQTVLILFMLISSWVMVIVGLQLLAKKSYNFRAETQHVLEQLRDGRAEDVYEEASPELQATIPQERFEARATDMNRTLGGFRQILALEPPETILDTPRGRTARVRVTLEFDKGTTKGQFSYHFTDGKWRLFGYGVTIPPELVATRSNLEAVARYEAPKDVLDLVKEILEKIRDGKGAEVFDQASVPFQQSVGNRERWLRRLEAWRERDGQYVRLIEFVKSAQDGSKTDSKIKAVVQYEKAKCDVTMSFINEDGVWKLSQYKVVVPAPRIPMLGASDPE